jgi:molybdopterin converting factor small subunit
MVLIPFFQGMTAGDLKAALLERVAEKKQGAKVSHEDLVIATDEAVVFDREDVHDQKEYSILPPVCGG